MADEMPWAERLDSPPLDIRPEPEEWRNVWGVAESPTLKTVSFDPTFVVDHRAREAADAAGATKTDG